MKHQTRHVGHSPQRLLWQQQKDLYDHVRFQFILIQLELALTFANMAASTSDRVGKARNLGYMRQAYNSATRFIDSGQMNPSRESEARSRIRELQKVFDNLGLLAAAY